MAPHREGAEPVPHNTGAMPPEAIDEVEDPNPPARASPEQVKKLREQAGKADEYWDKFVRTSAELDNYRKRAQRERLDAIKYANESLLEKLIPIIDNFDMAMAAVQNEQASSSDTLKTGVSMIHTQLKNFLLDAGLEEIDAAGKPFDPNLHEAVQQQETTEVPEGHVLKQLRKGYKLQDRLVRPASVIVSKKPGSES